MGVDIGFIPIQQGILPENFKHKRIGIESQGGTLRACRQGHGYGGIPDIGADINGKAPGRINCLKKSTIPCLISNGLTRGLSQFVNSTRPS